MTHHVKVAFAWDTVRRVFLRNKTNRPDYHETLARDLYGEMIDWCAENAPSYRHKPFDHDAVRSTIMRSGFDFKNPDPPQHVVDFEIGDLNEAIFFKLRWVG